MHLWYLMNIDIFILEYHEIRNDIYTSNIKIPPNCIKPQRF